MTESSKNLTLYQRIWPIFAAAFFVIGGYEFVRSPSVTLFQSHYGPSYTPYLMSLIPFLSLAAVYVFGRVLTSFGPRKTLLITTLASAILLVVSKLAIDGEIHWVRGFLFIFREVYIVLLIEQLWSLINSALKEEEAKTINNYFTGTTTIGAILGGLTVGYMSSTLGTANLLLISGFMLLPSLYFSNLAYLRNPRRTEKENHPKPEQKAGSISETLGLPYFKKEKLLLFLFFLVVIAQVLSTATGLNFQEHLHSRFTNDNEQTAFSGKFYALINVFSAAFQFVIGPWLMARVSFGFIQFLIPGIHLVLGIYSIFNPSLYSVGACFLAFKALDYSLFRSSKELLFIALPFDARYRTKSIIDIVGYRASKGVSSGVFAVFEYVGATLTTVYAWAGVLCVGVWLFIAPGLIKHVPERVKNLRRKRN